jgi:hypothetical protein
MTGTIVGGWDYIWAAYLVTWASLAGYGASLVFRARRARAAAAAARGSQP